MIRMFSLRAIAMLAPVIAFSDLSAHADWRAANPSVTQAARDPRVAGALAAVDAIDAAIVAGDKAGFVGPFADDAIVNSPFNNVTTRDQAAARFQTGALTSKYLHRSIEYAGPRRDDEVVLMGEEVYEPPMGHPFGGKTVHRRFTDIWRLQDGRWRLSVRQATVFRVE